jgi:hypothetical protein
MSAKLESAGHDPCAGLHAAQCLCDAGFATEIEKYFRWMYFPTPEWPETMILGRYMEEQMPKFVPKIYHNHLDATLGKEKVDELIAGYERLRAGGVSFGPGVHCNFVVVVGRKPVVV